MKDQNRHWLTLRFSLGAGFSCADILMKYVSTPKKQRILSSVCVLLVSNRVLPITKSFSATAIYTFVKWHLVQWFGTQFKLCRYWLSKKDAVVRINMIFNNPLYSDIFYIHIPVKAIRMEEYILRGHKSSFYNYCQCVFLCLGIVLPQRTM